MSEKKESGILLNAMKTDFETQFYDLNNLGF